MAFPWVEVAPRGTIAEHDPQPNEGVRQLVDPLPISRFQFPREVIGNTRLPEPGCQSEGEPVWVCRKPLNDENGLVGRSECRSLQGLTGQDVIRWSEPFGSLRFGRIGGLHFRSSKNRIPTEYRKGSSAYQLIPYGNAHIRYRPRSARPGWAGFEGPRDPWWPSEARARPALDQHLAWSGMSLWPRGELALAGVRSDESTTT